MEILFKVIMLLIELNSSVIPTLSLVPLVEMVFDMIVLFEPEEM